ncbi:MAG: HD domain-containing protein [Actinobacteria bacterium]|nr:MAG: HD domain-containing protein [Actinomycetota bacterium]
MPTLEDAISLALQAHKGQVDKAKKPYILHPLRLMAKMGTDEEMIAAVLHDVIEDSDDTVTLDDLRAAGYSKSVVEALDLLTKRDGETYEEFVERIRPNPLARKVKLADLEDNMNLARLPDPQPVDLERFKKYQRAWESLSGQNH